MNFAHVCGMLLLGGLLSSGSALSLSAQEDDSKRDMEYSLRVIDASPTITQVVDVNSQGDAIGRREIANADLTQFSLQYFFSPHSGEVQDLPLLKGYTNGEVSAISDNGKAVGFASRVLGHPEGSLTAIVWDTNNDAVTNLGAAKGDESSQAHSISDDGKRIAGYTTGEGRMRPCVWNWDQDNTAWQIEVLETPLEFNPFLMSAQVVISPDGSQVAACPTVEFKSNGQIDSAIYKWQYKENGWQSQIVDDRQGYLRAVSDSGRIVGSVSGLKGRQPFTISSEGQFQMIDLLPQDVSGEAWGIDSEGHVVGISDDPPGPDGGPQAFIWRASRTQPLELPGGAIFSAAYCMSSNGSIGGLYDKKFSSTDTKSTDQDAVYRTVGFVLTPKKVN